MIPKHRKPTHPGEMLLNISQENMYLEKLKEMFESKLSRESEKKN